MLALSLSACSAVSPGTAPVRDSSGQITESNDSTDVFALIVGDCTNDGTVTNGEVATVPAVPCAEPHDNEAFSSGTLPDGDFPGDESVATTANTMCLAAFEPFVGAEYDSSILGYFAIKPTEVSWGQGDRQVLCLAYDSTGAQLTGSVRDTAL